MEDIRQASNNGLALFETSPLYSSYFKHLGSCLWVAIELRIQKEMGMDKPKGECLVSYRYDDEYNLNDNKLVWA
ncbi:MAG: hypothetical protein ACI9YE_003490 [Psychroserpens sp.]